MLEWDFDRNKHDPTKLSPKSNVRAHWRCRFGHQWEASISNRNHNESGCPFCVNQSSRLEIFLLCELRTIFDEVTWRRRFEGVEADLFVPELDLAIEVDGDYWHAKKAAADNRKSLFFGGLGISLVRVRDERLPNVDGPMVIFRASEDKMVVFRDLMAALANLYPNRGLVPYTRRRTSRSEVAYREMVARLPAPPLGETLADLFPEVAAEWDYEANAPLTPELFTRAGDQKVAWVCAEGHQWKATIKNRTLAGSGCPTCRAATAGQRARTARLKKAGISLAEAHPELMAEWVYELNDVDPSELSPMSAYRAHWKCSQGHQWEAVVGDRTARGSGCRSCYQAGAGERVHAWRLRKAGISLAEAHPDLMAEWVYELNDIDPSDLPPRSGYRAHWRCPQGHEWVAAVKSRTANGSGCRICYQAGAGKRVRAAHVKKGGMSLASAYPELIAEWVYELNDIDPSDLPPRSGYRAHWRCPQGHEWEAGVNSRTAHSSGCPICLKARRSEIGRAAHLKKKGVSLAEAYPELMAQWVHDLNDADPSELSPQSHYRAHWRCPHGHEWETRVQTRTADHSGCPVCRRERSRTGSSPRPGRKPNA